MITAKQFVEQAEYGGYIGIPYERLDCQAFVEQVMKDLGALPTNWRGSNHMWRDAVYNRTKIVDSSEIPAGAWLFTVKDDGKEREKGYYDGLKNAVHVGIYLGNNKVIHSTKGGVQYSDIWSPRWTHYALCKYIDYEQEKQAENPTQKTAPSPRIIKLWDVTELSEEQLGQLMQFFLDVAGDSDGRSD